MYIWSGSVDAVHNLAAFFHPWSVLSLWYQWHFTVGKISSDNPNQYSSSWKAYSFWSCWQLILILYVLTICTCHDPTHHKYQYYMDWQSIFFMVSLTTNTNTIYLTICPLSDLPDNQYQYYMTDNPSSVWSSWKSIPILHDWQSVHWVIFLATNTNTVWLAICALCDLADN